jgi:hypothetical protein
MGLLAVLEAPQKFKCMGAKCLLAMGCRPIRFTVTW